jgi:hypothetical protein
MYSLLDYKIVTGQIINLNDKSDEYNTRKKLNESYSLLRVVLANGLSVKIIFKLGFKSKNW